MKLIIKTLDNSGIHEFVVTEELTVKALKEKIKKQIDTSLDQIKLLYKGRILTDEKCLKDYKIKDNDKLHVVIKKQSKPEDTEMKNTNKLYDPEEFWEKFEAVLKNQYESQTAQNIISQFRKDYSNMLTTISLDDIERIAKRKLED